MEKEIKHFDYIDALRGIAILMVVVAHVGQITFQSGLVLNITSLGVYGVQLFFMISALTLFFSYNQRKDVDSENTKRNFFIRRFFRIAPGFYLAIFIYSLVLIFNNYINYSDKIANFSVFKTIIYSIFLGLLYEPAMSYLPFGGWTVQVEMAFYILIPMLFNKIISLKKVYYYLFFRS